MAAQRKFVGGFAADKRTLLLRYEDGYPDDPTTPARLARSFGGTFFVHGDTRCRSERNDGPASGH